MDTGVRQYDDKEKQARHCGESRNPATSRINSNFKP
jgi:hypothetical protein